MDIDSSHTPNWLYDYGFDVPVAGADLPVVSSGGFNWVSPTFHGSSDTRWVCNSIFLTSCLASTNAHVSGIFHGYCKFKVIPRWLVGLVFLKIQTTLSHDQFIHFVVTKYRTFLLLPYFQQDTIAIGK